MRDGTDGAASGAVGAAALLRREGQGEEQRRDDARLEPRRLGARYGVVRRAGAHLVVDGQARAFARAAQGAHLLAQVEPDRTVSAERLRRQDGGDLGHGHRRGQASLRLPQGADARRRLARRRLVRQLLDRPDDLRVQAQPAVRAPLLPGAQGRGERDQVEPLWAAAGLVLRRLHRQDLVDEARELRAGFGRAYQGDLHDQVEPHRRRLEQSVGQPRPRQRLLRRDDPRLGP
mmetsp:Transcript_1715/g.3594  ORF Transcript_1715/g.3594 Transcript_1715/m.3594 type:complete len:232 (-) Transcript_1715:404-1099(-)